MPTTLIRPLTLLIVGILWAVHALGQAPYVLVLGTAQDGGYPQAGCQKECCRAVWEQKLAEQYVSSIALVDPVTKQQWIFDATPDFRDQLRILQQHTHQEPLDGIFLTHAHIGHYTGLMHLGREVMGAKQVPVYTLPQMAKFLTAHGPWSQLVSLQNIALSILEADQTIRLNDRLRVRPFRVPHRDEFSETVGYQIIGFSRRLVFIPDIDKWEKWEQDLTSLVRANDVLLLDGTFYEDGEISRPMSEVPHPFVAETMALLEHLPAAERAKVFFIHLNHSNPLLRPATPARQAVSSRGFGVAQQTQRFEL